LNDVTNGANAFSAGRQVKTALEQENIGDAVNGLVSGIGSLTGTSGSDVFRGLDLASNLASGIEKGDANAIVDSLAYGTYTITDIAARPNRADQIFTTDTTIPTGLVVDDWYTITAPATFAGDTIQSDSIDTLADGVIEHDSAGHYDIAATSGTYLEVSRSLGVLVAGDLSLLGVSEVLRAIEVENSLQVLRNMVKAAPGFENVAGRTNSGVVDVFGLYDAATMPRGVLTARSVNQSVTVRTTGSNTGSSDSMGGLNLAKLDFSFTFDVVKRAGGGREVKSVFLRKNDYQPGAGTYVPQVFFKREGIVETAPTTIGNYIYGDITLPISMGPQAFGIEFTASKKLTIRYAIDRMTGLLYWESVDASVFPSAVHTPRPPVPDVVVNAVCKLFRISCL
ncbi:MAG: hypothetical protein ACRCYU_15780, partial [Nocardioides sp.]